ncbi:sam-dependent methyltransferase [Trichoderma arundinaceum]|uniref:Sam-dependent methyltransferase n=1 Tax=Trichoderma arundinaceum TaxID=490622 RepID=A0A395NQ74_TRIAR|nr:sam-dependent methyltransferase [Trichoderma arundinaceum]
MSMDESGQAAMKQSPAQNAGSATYTPFKLRLYDLVVLRISNSYAWKCSTKKVQLPLFRSTIGSKHLDVGVGTGYYPANAFKTETPCKEITLVDLNPNTLDLAAARIAAVRNSVQVHSVVADVTESLPLPLGQKFDSVSIFYLLHCLAGPPESKTKIFSLLKDYVADDGVLVGTTILGEERSMNWLARRLMKLYNNKGIFDNWKDTRSVFEEGLQRSFDEVDVQIIGRIMVFTARKPKKAT